MSQTIKVTDLPSDVLYLIFPYLNAAEYLRFTNCTKAFSTYCEDPTFWRYLTRTTFRIPDQPLLQGERWQWLYKKLLTQTRLYTWGSNGSGNLGHEGPEPEQAEQIQELRLHPPANIMARRTLRARPRSTRNSGWPREAAIGQEVGIVADVQCGGWSTTILDSIGAIHMFGIFDGQRFRAFAGSSSLKRLEFPPAYPQTTKNRYEPSTAIQQYSTGRSSVLGLADDGKVWMWESYMGSQVKPMHVDLVENKVARVAAGWDRNSMYVMDVGIVYWTSVQDSDVIRGGRQEALAVADMMLIDCVTIPGTGHRRKKNERCFNDNLESRIGAVTNHIVLAEYIVFTTDLNKVFCYPTTYPMPALNIPEPIELTTFYTASTSETFKIRDLQGSFTRFAIFTESGRVFTASHDLLHAFRDAARASSLEGPQILPSPALVPSLQAQTIISLAFGDHHFLALHSNGSITSYGQELQSCGSLGLGNAPQSKLRGVRADPGHWGNSRLPEGEGRTVWFDPLMETWLEDMWHKNAGDGGGEHGTMLHAGHEGVRRAYADHFEKEGAKWEENVTKEGEMGAYFGLKVAAAGWSSAALVLVDEEKAEQARRAHEVDSSTRPPPSPALSVQSVDSKGFAYEVIDSPGEQLINAIHAVYAYAWELGRRFLGLTARDAAREAEKKKKEAEEKEMEYTWSKASFPRLELPDADQ